MGHPAFFNTTGYRVPIKSVEIKEILKISWKPLLKYVKTKDIILVSSRFVVRRKL